MDRKRRRMIEGMVYFFSLPRGQDKARISVAIENALAASNSGRILGSGTSLFNDCTIAIEIGAYDQHAADAAVFSACKKMKCRDYEVVWD